MRRSTVDEWEVKVDPDVEKDLGYRLAEWSAIRHQDDVSRVVFLPEDEELLHDDAYIVVEEDSLCDLAAMT